MQLRVWAGANTPGPKEVSMRSLKPWLRSATFRNGLLVVTMPKTPAAKGFTIPVKPE